MAFKIAHQRFILRLDYSRRLDAKAVSSLTEDGNPSSSLQAGLRSVTFGPARQGFIRSPPTHKKESFAVFCFHGDKVAFNEQVKLRYYLHFSFLGWDDASA